LGELHRSRWWDAKRGDGKGDIYKKRSIVAAVEFTGLKRR